MDPTIANQRSTFFLIFCGLIVGIVIFSKGFLLSRSELSDKATCVPPTQEKDAKLRHPPGYYCPPPQFQKLVILIVDALKYDFIDPTIAYNDSVYSAGNMKVIADVIAGRRQFASSKGGSDGMVARFLADPPTTTLQRLKGLTTGGLPTFIDVSSNFGGSEITEDNLLDQWIEAGKRIVFMGDDTWTGLFPNRFVRSYPYPSFNVKDLDTVDQGVLRHLDQELLPTKKPSHDHQEKGGSNYKTNVGDWDILIAHFLGVDHCGHTYGPDHPQMRRKLSEMNTMLEMVISRLPENSLLVLLGDHGMTPSGDHGGDSHQELEAGLFLYSSAGGRELSFSSSSLTQLPQIDLVPSLALLTGRPIPFSSVGVVRSEIMPKRLRGTAILRNLHQMRTYIDRYEQKFGEDFTRGDFAPLLRQLDSLIAEANQSSTSSIPTTNSVNVNQSVRVLEEIREKFREKWTRFDTEKILLGLIVSGNSVVQLFLLDYLKGPSVYFVIGSLVVALSSLLLEVVNLPAIVVCAGLLLVNLASLLSLIRSKISGNWAVKPPKYFALVNTDFLGLVFCLILFGSQFSNSFVVNEDIVLRFLLQTLLLARGVNFLLDLAFFTNQRKLLTEAISKQQHRRSLHRWKPLLLLTSVALLPCFACLALLVSLQWRICREEQQAWCDTRSLTKSLATISDQFRSYKSARFFSSALATSATIFGHRILLRHLGNLNGTSPAVMTVFYLIPVTTMLLIMHWVVQSLPENILRIMDPWQQTVLPRLTLTTALTALCLLVKWPVTVFTRGGNGDDSSDLNLPYYSSDWRVVVPHVWNHLKAQAEDTKGKKDRRILVYGLGSVYSAWHFTLLLIVSLLLVLFLGDGHAISIILSVFIFLAFASINALGFYESAYRLNSSWFAAAFCLLLSRYTFYTTGHQPAIANIQWQAAYVISHGEHTNHILPALTILVNTLAGSILVAAALPLLATVACPGPCNPITKLAALVTSSAAMNHHQQTNGCSTDQKEKQAENWKSGELAFAETELTAALYSVSLKTIFLRYLALVTLQAWLSMCAAGLHSRHLMVWKIFAPQMMFAVVGCLSNFVICGLFYTVSLRLHHRVVRWCRDFARENSNTDS